MMDAMPRPRLPHLHRELTRHGRAVWYVRLGKGPRIRLRADYGSPEFDAAYQAAISGTAPTAPRKPGKGSLAWLVAQYRECASWLALSPATRRQRENIFERILASAGTDAAGDITRKSIVAGLERRSKTPSAARNFLDTMRGLFEWAKDAEHVKADPTLGVKPPARPRSAGFKKWTEDEVAQYEARWPLGTKERVWLDVLLYTGLRRGDAVRLGRQHVRNGVATLRTEKSQGEIPVTIPILPILQATLDDGPTGELAFICGARGKPLTKESFGNVFKEACVKAGVMGKGKAAHGLRKVGATRAAQNGATVSQLNAIFGWRGARMASLYTEEADRARLSKGAIDKLARTAE